MQPIKDITQLSNIIANFEFYDFKNLNGKNDIKIIFSKEFCDVRYGDIAYGADKNDYLEKEDLICEFVFKVMDAVLDKDIVIKRYNEKWIVNKRLSKSLYEELKANKVEKAEAVLVDKNSKAIRLFTESALRYNSFFEFLFPLNKFVLCVTDHMDIFVSVKNPDTLLLIKNIITTMNKENSKYSTVFEIVKIEG